MPTESSPEYDETLGDKFVFVTGGVMSGLGKGITAASLGRLLENAGFDVTAVKIDPYLNVDAGTMNPFQHGEVYVLDDGAEVDLDLGNYERFLDVEMTAANNITTGKVYQDVIEKERSGEYLGKTVQIIPHITDNIKKRIREVAEGHDVCIIEVGGTVGDIEGMPFLEALRQFQTEEASDDFLLTHVTLLPYSEAGEQKTKPTQHSVKEVRSIGLQPDIIVGRCEDQLEEKPREKIALFCDVPTDAVISNPDVDEIYEVPEVLEAEGFGEYVMEQLGIADDAYPEDDRDYRWRDRVTAERTDSVEIALVGKYGMDDAYMSVYEALRHAGMELNTSVETRWVHAEDITDSVQSLTGVDGIIVPGGFGERGVGGKIRAAQYARENDVPYLGLCLGFQVAVIEYAQNVLGLTAAHSTEFDEDTPHPVIDIMPEQYDVENLGGTMRLGAYTAAIESDSLADTLYTGDTCEGRHRHRFEVNPDYIDRLEAGQLTFSGEMNNRMELVEYAKHPFFFGTQFHPEYNSRPLSPSPAFVGLVTATLDRSAYATTTGWEGKPAADAR
ncbi:CTP synthase [Salinibaculum rarum]|uniref:CTP synthase n=1 Tax=Salinibaculum rarum TaxID=3058903 RepID=UPI00265E0426|nr:CTP synthase [Salinibaculum sp. KK48]